MVGITEESTKFSFRDPEIYHFKYFYYLVIS